LTVAITAVGAITVAIISGISGAMTAWLNGRSVLRLDYLKAARELKTKQVEDFRNSLNTRLQLLLALRGGMTPAEAEKTIPQGDPVRQAGSPYLPLFISVDPFAARLVSLANQQQLAIREAFTGQKPDKDKRYPPEALIEVERLVHILIILSQFLDSSTLQDTSDPT